jgi:ArsR family transcriptional regulator
MGRVAESARPACLDSGPIVPRYLTPGEISAVAKALGHPTRLRVLELFELQCPRNVGDICEVLPIAQSTVSEHLRVLRDADVIWTLRTDSRSWHCLNRSVLRGFTAAIYELTDRDRLS